MTVSKISLPKHTNLLAL
jgi:hypothetical protein